MPRFAPPILILLAGLLAYHNSLHGHFVFDDLPTIVANPHIKSLWPLSTPLTTPPQTPIAARPVASLTFALNYAMTGLNPVSYHATNLAIHLATALLVYALTRLTLNTPRLTALNLPPKTITLLATTSALLFTLHPLNNECVAYLMQRTESMTAFFTLLTLYLFARGATLPPPTSRSSFTVHRSAFFVSAALSCALGMGCKEVMVAAPLLVLVYDRLFLSQSWRAIWKSHKLPHLLIFSSYLILIIILWDNPRSETSNFSFARLTPWNYLKTQAHVLTHYLRLAIFPHPLVVDYYDWPLAERLLPVLPHAALVLTLLAATFYGIYRAHPLGFVGAVFFFTLAPTSSFIPLFGEYAAERRMYLPMTALVPAAVVGVHLLLRRHLPPRARVRLEFALVLAIAFAMTLATVRRNEAFATDQSLWEDTVAKRPNNARAWANLGATYLRLEDYPAAYAASARAASLDPGLHTTHRVQALAATSMRRFDDAFLAFRKSLAAREDPVTRAAYARALADAGQFDRAFRQFDRALAADPDNPDYHNAYGFALAQSGRIPDAIPHFTRAISLNPALAAAHYNLALAHQAQGTPHAAAASLRRTVELQPTSTQPLDQLAWLLATHPDPTIRNPQEAQQLARRAIELHPPNDPTPLDTLAAAQAAAADFPAAIDSATRALTLATQQNSPLTPQIQHRHSLYRQHKPYLQPARPPATRSSNSPTTTPTSRP